MNCLTTARAEPLCSNNAKTSRDRLLDLLVGIEGHLASGVEDQADRWPEAELSLLGLLQLAAEQPTPQPMECGLAHRPLEAQQQAIVVEAGVIDALFIDDQGLGQGADFQEPIPVATRASRAGDLEAEAGARAPEADFGDEELEAIPVGARGPRVPLILIDDGNLRRGPPEIPGTLN